MTGSPWSEPGALRVGNNDALDLLTKACDLCLDVRTANSRVLQQLCDERAASILGSPAVCARRRAGYPRRLSLGGHGHRSTRLLP